MTRRPGNPNIAVILADVSASIPYMIFSYMDKAIAELRRRVPGIRVFAFLEEIAEVPEGEGVYNSSWGAVYKPNTKLGQDSGTHIGHCLASVAALNPSKTVIFSDGGACDKRLLFRTADSMTGSIDAYYCPPSHVFYGNLYPNALNISEAAMYKRLSGSHDPGAMQMLARRGGGRYHVYDYLQDLSIPLIESFRVCWQRRIHHHHFPDLHIYPGAR